MRAVLPPVVLLVVVPSVATPLPRKSLFGLFITLSPADLVFRNLSGKTVRHARRDRDAPP